MKIISSETVNKKDVPKKYYIYYNPKFVNVRDVLVFYVEDDIKARDVLLLWNDKMIKEVIECTTEELFQYVSFKKMKDGLPTTIKITKENRETKESKKNGKVS